MSRHWDSRLETGIETIDEQHRRLFRSIDALVDAVSQSHAKEDIEKLLAFLLDYVGRHFSTEEGIMFAWRYPLKKTHEYEHREFKRELRDVEKSYRKYGATTMISIKLSSMTRHWLREHILNHDMPMAIFLKKKLTEEKKEE